MYRSSIKLLDIIYKKQTHMLRKAVVKAELAVEHEVHCMNLCCSTENKVDRAAADVVQRADNASVRAEMVLRESLEKVDSTLDITASMHDQVCTSDGKWRPGAKMRLERSLEGGSGCSSGVGGEDKAMYHSKPGLNKHHQSKWKLSWAYDDEYWLSPSSAFMSSSHQGRRSAHDDRGGRHDAVGAGVRTPSAASLLFRPSSAPIAFGRRYGTVPPVSGPPNSSASFGAYSPSTSNEEGFNHMENEHKTAEKHSKERNICSGCLRSFRGPGTILCTVTYLIVF